MALSSTLLRRQLSHSVPTFFSTLSLRYLVSASNRGSLYFRL